MQCCRCCCCCCFRCWCWWCVGAEVTLFFSFRWTVAARLVGAPEREITPERKGNRISEHNKAATPEKMTWEAGGVPTSQRGCLFPEYIFRGGRKSAIHITTGCRFVCSLPWQNRGHTSSLIAGGERKKSQKRGAGGRRGGSSHCNSSCPWVWCLVTQGVCWRSHMVQMDHINLPWKQYALHLSPPLNSSLFLYLFSALSPSSRNIKAGSSGWPRLSPPLFTFSPPL